MNEKGSQNFIKLDRRILDNDIMRDPLALQLFIYCILVAEWQPVIDKGVEVPRGSFITTMGQIAKDLNRSYKSIRVGLGRLTRCEGGARSGAGYLARLKVGKRLMITVVNYDKWQGEGTIRGTIRGTENASLPIKEKEYKKGGQESQWET